MTAQLQEWLQKADDDFLAAKWLLNDQSPVYIPALFHLQQATEKWLKALLIAKQQDFDRRHDLHYLLEILGESALGDYANLMDQLTPFAVEIRYPGDLPYFSKSEAVRILEEVTCLRKDVLALI